jgi:transmembrane sensor
VSLWDAYGQALAGPDEMTSRRLEREVLAQSAAPPRRRGVGWARAGIIGFAAVLVAALTFAIVRPGSSPPEPAVVTVATTTHAQDLALPRDGVLRVEPGSRVDVRVSDETGAIVRLLDGEVSLHVRAGHGMRWIVDVDDYSVEALGTRYRVRRTDAAPAVHVDEGVVRLIGPGLPAEGMRISAAGRTEDARGAEHPAATTEPEAGPPPAPSPEPVHESSAEEPASQEVEPAEVHRVEPAWIARFRDAIDAGDAARAVAALPAAFPNGREPLTAAEFLDAGDALASQRQTRRAEDAYRAACRRSRHPACGVATFRLALIAARRSDLESAIELSTRYLEDHPDGSLAREVFGRRMQWRKAGHDVEGARRDARRYLARWPDGPHAALARRLAGASLEAP